MSVPDVRPAEEGYAVPVRCGDDVRAVWWGPREGEDGEDVVAARSGRVLTWPDAATCAREVVDRGWTTTPAFVDDELDFSPVLAWLRGRALRLDRHAALTTWNLAGDVASSLALPRHDRGRRSDRCYDLLFAAAVPWLGGLESWQPRWSSRDVSLLRARLGDDLALLRREVFAVGR
ncbi:MAG: hypothetical protein U0Q15_12280 [Kineosporiaceae bacterium]